MSTINYIDGTEECRLTRDVKCGLLFFKLPEEMGVIHFIEY